jgi:hypothetical protein
VGLAAVALLLFGTLGISTAFGMLLLLLLYVQELGGNEANFGTVLSAATVTAVLCIGFYGPEGVSDRTEQEVGDESERGTAL